MRCPSCDHDNNPARRCCAECGVAFVAGCASCGAASQPGEKFCGGCGSPLTPALSTAPTRSPATYTPEHLAERILTSRSALEGERKQVTVLFADVKGLMDLAEQLDPEEWSQIMRRSASVQAERLAKDTSP